MSNINICLTLLIIYLTLQNVTAKSAEEISYIEKTINFQYENDQWICGDVECPEKTFGCKISLQHTKGQDDEAVYQSFNCFDESKFPTVGAGVRLEIPKEIQIDIELESYVGAVSNYFTGYSLGGHEIAKGVVAVEDLNYLKEDAKDNREAFGNPA
ncbi:uncharacterized protein LOC119606291 [Lucilia sericata]|uniref:uncharacterized protein LOC119606291 n=1 Tax=Lucilia sericata TaxID=13632 RepID=UPI0018A8706D|nr:uncharacterized protein LOC119606291 [Lucilia sericata]